MLNRPPGSLSDQTALFLSDALGLLTSAHAKYGDVFTLSVFGRPNVFLIGPMWHRFVLRDRAEWFSAKEGNLDVGTALLGDSLLYSDGDDHFRKRSLLAPAFGTRSMAEYFDTMREIVSAELRGWHLLSNIDVYERCRRVSLEVMGRVLLGISFGADVDRVDAEIRRVGQGLYADRVSRWPWGTFGRARRARGSLAGRVSAIGDRAGDNSRTRFLGLLAKRRAVAGGTRFVSDEIIDFLFAGTDTTSALMAWAVWYISQDARVLAKIEAELHVSHAGTLDELKRLAYLDAVVSEVLRLKPPVYFIPRMAVRDVEAGGFLIPKGWLVNVAPILAHRLPEFFSQPQVFDPERFLPPRSEQVRTPYAFIGFGSGPKGCIGALFAEVETKLFLVTLLSLYRLSVAGPEPKSVYVSSLHPESGPMLTAEPRADAV